MYFWSWSVKPTIIRLFHGYLDLTIVIGDFNCALWVYLFIYLFIGFVFIYICFGCVYICYWILLFLLPDMPSLSLL